MQEKFIMTQGSLRDYVNEWQRVTKGGVEEVFFIGNTLSVYCKDEVSTLRLFVWLHKQGHPRVCELNKHRQKTDWFFECKLAAYADSAELNWKDDVITQKED